ALAAFLTAAMPTAAGEQSGLVPALPLARLGAQGLFAALLIALGTVELARLFVRRGWTIRIPKTAPEMVIRSFLALIPGAASIVLVFLITQVLKLDVLGALDSLARPLLRATGSLPAAIAVVAVDSALWLVGVHASAALGTMKPLWEAMLLQNMEAVSRGAGGPPFAPPHGLPPF